MRWLLALFSIFAVVPSVWAEELKLFTMHLPPFTMENSDRPGYAVEITQEVARRAKLDLSVNFRPWTRAQTEVRHGRNLAILPLARTDEREPHYTWVGELFDIEVNFVDISGRGHTRETARKLNSVLVQEGTSFVTSLRNDGFTNLVTRPDTVNNGRMLAGGRVAAWYVSNAEALWVWKMAKLAGKPTIGPKIADERQWIALSPDADPHLVERLREAIASVIADGTRDRIIRSYLD